MSVETGEQRAQIGDVELCYETFGDRSSPPLLLIMGLASQMIVWDDEFCQRIADRGFWVTRFDNRDCGRSTVLRDAVVPKRWQLMLRNAKGAAYKLDTLADDAAGLLDHLGVDSAHVVGASMGGMIAQLLAIRHPERVRSLTSIMSTTGNRRVGQPHPRIFPLMLRPAPREREAFLDSFLYTYKAIGSPALPAGHGAHARARRALLRPRNPSGRHGASDGRDRHSRRPHGGAGATRCAGDRDPRRLRSTHQTVGRARDGQGDPGRKARDDPGDGPRPPAGAMGSDHRRDRANRRPRRPDDRVIVRA